MNKLLVILCFLGFFLILGCEDRPRTNPVINTDSIPTSRATSITDKYELTPVVIFLNGEQVGGATIIKDSFGSFLISARHIFDKKGVYEVLAISETREVVGYIAKLSGTSDIDIVIGKLQQVPKSIEPHKTSFFDDVNGILDKGGYMHIMVFSEEREIIVSEKRVHAVARWGTFSNAAVDAIDYRLSPGWSGMGVVPIGMELQMFYVVSGPFPEEFKETIEKMSGKKAANGFTMVSGLSWAQIQKIRASL